MKIEESAAQGKAHSAAGRWRQDGQVQAAPTHEAEPGFDGQPNG